MEGPKHLRDRFSRNDSTGPPCRGVELSLSRSGCNPAPRGTRMEHLTIEEQIRLEIYGPFEHLGADRELLKLLGTIGSWGGTLDDEEVLNLLREWLARYVAPDRKLSIC